jgi:DNA repair ATPase RecN
LATLGQSTQVILFTHHAHVADLAEACPGARVQHMPGFAS